jgi:DNA repair exonuclease SbcCD ATPase subunit
MFKIKTLTVKNFMSVGNATQAVNFDRKDLTLVLGENLDLGGDDSGARNGTGKTTIINALSYALYGNALTNIKKDNLINKTNGKNMLVTIEFEKDGIDYRIERGRKPNVMKFWVAGDEQEITDDAQGDSRETQADIERMLGMEHEMFKHVVALNTYTEPFLALRANDQRTIIEQLLGITLLSEKADRLKEQIKATKDAITQEEARIKAVQDANRRIEEQIESLRKRQRLWVAKQDEDCDKMRAGIAELEKIDIEAEIQAHRDLVSFNEEQKTRSDLAKAQRQSEAELDRLTKLASKLEKEIVSLKEHKCYACGQDIHDAKQDEILNSKQSSLTEAQDQAKAIGEEVEAIKSALLDLGDLRHPPVVFYDTLEDALNHRNTLETLKTNLVTREAEHDPYSEQIREMEEAAVEEVNYDTINEIARVRDHQDFLLKLLTSKDSFVRKRIIDQNLAYLNQRLSYYLDRIGLPHTVKFQNDLTVEITELGRDLDFDNLSRGERNRLILSLSWAFRDVWEGLYQPINLLFIDELVDSGMDSSGVENALAILKKMSRDVNRSVWLVSHKDELAGRVNNIMHVVKENGFTTYNTDVEVAGV